MENPTEVTTESIEDSLGDMIHGDEVEENETPVDEHEDDTEDDQDATDQDDEVEEDEPESPPGDDETVEVEFEGQLIEAPKAVAEALMRNKDYTEKTQQLAADRKQIEIQSTNLQRVNKEYEFAQQVQSDIVQANQIETQIENVRTYMRENVEALTHTDIEKIRMSIDDLTQQRDKIIQDVTAKNTEFQQAQEQSLKELRDKSTEVLRQKVPGWGETHEANIKEYALSQGVPEQAYNSVVDPIEKEILYKAMQFDALKSGAVPAVKAVKAAPTIKSKSRNQADASTRKASKLRKQMKSKSLTDKQKAKLLEDDIGDSLFS